MIFTVLKYGQSRALLTENGNNYVFVVVSSQVTLLNPDVGLGRVAPAAVSCNSPRTDVAFVPVLSALPGD